MCTLRSLLEEHGLRKEGEEQERFFGEEFSERQRGEKSRDR